jgi:hypothetical protein
MKDERTMSTGLLHPSSFILHPYILAYDKKRSGKNRA